MLKAPSTHAFSNNSKESPLVSCYVPLPISFDYGKGSYLYDKSGKNYLDFCSGIASCSLGHCNPIITETIAKQSKKLMHVSNLYVINEAVELARLYVASCFADRVFFCNSGTEAIESGIKMVRAYQYGVGQKKRYRIISFNNSFHGRTIAAASASGKITENLAPVSPGFDMVHTNIASVKNAISAETAAILIEPIQGEGGIRVMSEEFLCDLRKLCDEEGLLLFFDCVQCGAGRTGKLFAYQHAKIEPDLCSLAKGMGGGFPIGACFAKEHVATHMKPGMHGTTFGGNPLATAVGKAVFCEINKKEFLDSVRNKGEYLKKQLEDLKLSNIEQVVGKGLMLGLRLDPEFEQVHSQTEIITKLLENGLLCVRAANSTIRLLPPLTVSKSEIDHACIVLKNFFGSS